MSGNRKRLRASGGKESLLIALSLPNSALFNKVRAIESFRLTHFARQLSQISCQLLNLILKADSSFCAAPPKR